MGKQAKKKPKKKKKKERKKKSVPKKSSHEGDFKTYGKLPYSGFLPNCFQ